jgi:hypothetical protein
MGEAATRERPASWLSESRFALRTKDYPKTPGFCVCGHQGRSHVDDFGDCRKCACSAHTRPVCSVLDCGRPTLGLTFCNRHLLRNRRHGSPLAGGDFHGDAKARFWRKVDKTASCWLWTGALDRLGYARFKPVPELMVMVHRFAYEDLVGPIPAELEIDHLCRVRHCVNPGHLEPVTHDENMNRRRVRLPGTLCKRGHVLSPENAYEDRGILACRGCHLEASRAWRARKAHRDGVASDD